MHRMEGVQFSLQQQKAPCYTNEIKETSQCTSVGSEENAVKTVVMFIVPFLIKRSRLPHSECS